MTNLIRRNRIKPERKTTPEDRKYIADYIDRSVPEKHKMATERALFKQVPRSVAIKTKCLSCCNFDREEVKMCSIIICPLNPYRPYQDKNVEVDVEEVDAEEEDDE